MMNAKNLVFWLFLIYSDAYSMDYKEKESQLEKAIEVGDIAPVRDLLSLLIDNSNKVEYFTTALLCAIKKNHKEIVSLALEKEPDINFRASDNSTPLMYAVAFGYKEIVDLLLDKGADIALRNKQDDTVLTLMAKQLRSKIFRSNKRKEEFNGDDFTLDEENPVKEDNPNTATFIYNPRYTEIASSLLRKGADVNACDNQGVTALMIAASIGIFELAKFFLDNGALVDAQDNNNHTSLIMACSYGYKNIVALLIEKGAAVNIQGKVTHFERRKFITPLNAAAIQEYARFEGVITLLLEKGAQDVDKSATLYAIHLGYPHLLAKLIENGEIDIEANIDGHNILVHAIRAGRKRIVSWLLDKGVDVNSSDSHGWTPLVEALMHFCDTKLVKLILDKGAYVNIRDSFDNIPLTRPLHGKPEEAKSIKGLPMPNERGRCHNEAMNLLIARGANVNHPKSFEIEYVPKESIQLLEISRDPEAQRYLKNPLLYAQKKAYVNSYLTTLMLASIFSHTDIILFYKDKTNEYINARDAYGYSAFDYAILYNQLDSAAVLINCFGLTLNILPSDSILTSALSYVPYVGQKRNEKTELASRQNEILEFAVIKGHKKLVNALLTVGAKPTILLAQIARAYGRLKIMHTLLFATLDSLPNKHSQITLLSKLFSKEPQ